MSDQELYDKLKEIFEDVLGLDDVALTPETTADDIEEWDSLSHINIIVSVEKAFNFRFTAVVFSGLANVGQFVSLIREKSQG